MEIDHPDLIEIGSRLRRRFEAVLDAEREAAVIAARRASDLRSFLIDAEDQRREVFVSVADGGEVQGILRAVGSDHIEITHRGQTNLVVLSAIRAVRFL
jgi:hypothetical protein